jgi:hypothetical protein
MGSLEDRKGTDRATLAFKGSECWILFCRTSLKHSNSAHIACSHIGYCVLLSVWSDRTEYVIWLWQCVSSVCGGFYVLRDVFYGFDSFWKHVIHYCIIIPDIVPSPSILFTCKVNFQVSANFITKIDL